MLLVVKQIGVGGIGPASFIRKLLQKVSMLPKGFHTGNDLIPEITGHFFSAGRPYMLQPCFEFFTAGKQSICSVGKALDQSLFCAAGSTKRLLFQYTVTQEAGIL